MKSITLLKEIANDRPDYNGGLYYEEISLFCPSEYGLIDLWKDIAQCKSCQECWKAAIKQLEDYE